MAFNVTFFILLSVGQESGCQPSASSCHKAATETSVRVVGPWGSWTGEDISESVGLQVDLGACQPMSRHHSFLPHEPFSRLAHSMVACFTTGG